MAADPTTAARPREPRGPVERRRPSAAWVLGAVALLPVLAYLVTVVPRLGYPYELTYFEGSTVEVMARVVAGEPLYAAPTTTWTPWPYPPLYFWLCAALAHLTGVSLLPMRLVSLVGQPRRPSRSSLSSCAGTRAARWPASSRPACSPRPTVSPGSGSTPPASTPCCWLCCCSRCTPVCGRAPGGAGSSSGRSCSSPFSPSRTRSSSPPRCCSGWSCAAGPWASPPRRCWASPSSARPCSAT